MEDAAPAAAPSWVALARPPRAVSATTLGLAYFLALGGAGAWLPFFGLFLYRSGYTGRTIGGLMAAMTLARLLAAPLWSWLADRTQRGEWVLVLASFVSVGAAAVALWVPAGPLALGAALLVFSASRGSIGTLLDAQTILALARDGHDARHYGRVRLWGSVGFLIVALAAGFAADRDPRAPLVLAIGVWGIGAVLTLTFPRTPPSAPVRLAPALRALAKQPFFAPFVAAAVLHGMALSLYDNVIAIHVDTIGLASRWTGIALVVGIAGEVVLMSMGRAVLARIEPLRLVALAMGLGVLRWLATAVITEPLPLVAVQLLHGLVFGGFWIGGVELLRRHSPEHIRTSAQAVLGASAYGVGALLAGGAIAFGLDRACTKGLLSLGAASSAVAALLALWALRR